MKLSALWKAPSPASAPDSGRKARRTADLYQIDEARRPQTVECPFCGSREFRDFRIPRIRCRKCGSTERIRVAKLLLDDLDLPRPGMRVMHIAPELPLAKYLFDRCGNGYEARDAAPARYNFDFTECKRLDLCKEAQYLPSDHYDLIVHNHVIEHVRCNYTMVLLHLHRALKRDGLHMFSIPFTRHKSYAENLSRGLDKQTRTREFGQSNHYRRFTLPHFHATVGAIFDIPIDYDLSKHIPPDTLRRFNIVEEHWKLGPASIFVLRKEDCPILRQVHHSGRALPSVHNRDTARAIDTR